METNLTFTATIDGVPVAPGDLQFWPPPNHSNFGARLRALESEKAALLEQVLALFPEDGRPELENCQLEVYHHDYCGPNPRSSTILNINCTADGYIFYDEDALEAIAQKLGEAGIDEVHVDTGPQVYYHLPTPKAR